MEEYSEKDALDERPLKPDIEENEEGSLENETPTSHVFNFEPIKEPRGKMYGTNWLADVSSVHDCDYVKVQFKNTRSGFYLNADKLDLKIGDMVAVEASPGHDIGEVVMVGRLVARQMEKANLRKDAEVKKIFRRARQADLERYEEAKSREEDTMIRSRKIAADLGLQMKIGDVEYQGDGGKAIFYYIADERVDFRKLIRLLADAFKVRIEMKQIGARQEAGRIGGIGPCGRPLCCASWMNHFVSVSTTMARMQDLSMNPQKLAGQCAKLKCCLNFEAAAYHESQSMMPHKDVILQTKDADYYLFKSDPLNRMVTYTPDKGVAANAVTIPLARAHEIIALNKQGIKVDMLEEKSETKQREIPGFVDLVGQDSLTRFDKAKKKKKKKKPQQPQQQVKEKQPQTGKPKQQDGKQKQAAQRQNQPGSHQEYAPAKMGQVTKPRGQKPRQADYRPRQSEPRPRNGEVRQMQNDKRRRRSNNPRPHQGGDQ